jgi:hypothetical protein
MKSRGRNALPKNSRSLYALDSTSSFSAISSGGGMMLNVSIGFLSGTLPLFVNLSFQPFVLHRQLTP